MATDLELDQLFPALTDPALASMDLLNEIGARHPGAVSFAAGQPTEEFFDVADVHRYLDRFCAHLAGRPGPAPAHVLFQYGRTKGVIHDLVARNLAADEGITVDPEAVVITVGCQEALFLVLRTLRSDDADVVLAVRPTYVGLEGAARLAGIRVLPVDGGETGVDLEHLVATTRRARSAGLRPRACYVMPEFANPSGVSLDLGDRHRLLEIAEQEDLLLIEDNPYGLFHDRTGRRPALKSLDRSRRVLYLGSFAKSVMPGARVGYVCADQVVIGPGGTRGRLADQLARVKGALTINTSPVAQAVIGGCLLENDFRLLAANAGPRRQYAERRRLLIEGLAKRFPPGSGVSWNTPDGGFFVVVTLPFAADDALLRVSAREYGVLWTPLHYFYGGAGGARQARLSVSRLDAGQIETGLDRFAALVAGRVPAPAPGPGAGQEIE